MTKHSDTEWCLFHNGYGVHIGSNAMEARDWLEAHPEYQGRVYGDWDTGGPRDQFEATELFETLLAENAKRAEAHDKTLANLASEHNENRVGSTPIHVNPITPKHAA